MTLPDAPKSLGEAHAAREAAAPINDLQRDIISAFDALRRRAALLEGGDAAAAAFDDDELPKLQGEAAAWIEGVVDKLVPDPH